MIRLLALVTVFFNMFISLSLAQDASIFDKARKIYPQIDEYIRKEAIYEKKEREFSPICLGVYGKVFPIEEEDLLSLFQKRAARLAQRRKEFERIAKESVKRHAKVSLNLPHAKKHKTFYVDPTFVLPDDITDEKGNVLFKKGTKINPLDYVTLSKTYVLIDERSDEQVRFAKGLLKKGPKRTTVILTDGDVFRWFEKTKVWAFKAPEELIERLCIEATPSVISQEGKLIKVEEVAVEKKTYAGN